MKKEINQVYHPHGVITPDNVAIILYYTTRVVKATVYPRMDLTIFRTSCWWNWIRKNNLPPSIAYLMNGTLEDYTKFDIAPENIDSTNVNLDDESAAIVEEWLEGWRTQCVSHGYKQHSMTEFRILLSN